MGNSENLFENENNGEELNQEKDQPSNEVNSEQGNEQHEYSYTYSNDDGDTINGETEPTVTFDSVSELHENRRNNGVKVFFSIIAVIIALIIAVSAGFIFGTKSGTINYNINQPTQLNDRDTSKLQTDKSVVFNNVNPSIVAITIYTDDGVKGYASGVIYSEDGYIVTNDHIYSEVPSAKFLITMFDGSEFKAEFVAGDTRSDIAVLKGNVSGLKKAKFANSDQLVIGEEAIAIGYPQGADGKSILTSGIISSKGVRVSSTSSYSMKMIQTDAPINPGNSGGALVDMYSNVIGITSVKLTGTYYDNVGYAIPSNTVVKIADSLIKYGYVEGRGRLGITYTEVDKLSAELDNLPTGLLVASISDDSDLANKGIDKGDIITHINDVEIKNSNQALDIIENTKPNVAMSFTVYHAKNGKSETIFASLLADQGNSSYTNNIIEEDKNNIFENDDIDDFFSDH